MNILLRKRRPVVDETYKYMFLHDFNKEVDEVCRKHKIEFIFTMNGIIVWNPYRGPWVEQVMSNTDAWKELVAIIEKHYDNLQRVEHTSFSYMNGDNKVGVHYRDANECRNWKDNIMRIFFDGKRL